ncbi:MAG: hypothetical protein ACREFX_09005 [Opitutaceae bacterium]
MSENILVPLPGFHLPADFPWRVGFVVAVEQELRRLRAAGRFRPQRFFGYYFRKGRPVGVSGPWTVALEANDNAMRLLEAVDQITRGEYHVVAPNAASDPDFLLIHDRLDGECWLWHYRCGLRFVEATEPVEMVCGGWGDSGDQKLLGP